MQIRRANERGHANHGWLDSHHTFSFANYFDPEHMGFGPLRVINEDRVSAGQGFGRHPHKSMEIISYVLDGALEHKDSMGNGSVIRPGDVQYMSAGTGVLHSEYNHSKTDPVHFLQIWIVPEAQGGSPRYDQKHFPLESRTNTLRLVASSDGRDGSIQIRRDVDLWATVLDAGKDAVLEARPGRSRWVHVARGSIDIAAGDGRETLRAGDAAAVGAQDELRLRGVDGDEAAEVLVFDMAGATQ